MAIIVKSTAPDGSVNISAVERVQYMPNHIDGAPVVFADEAPAWCGKHECLSEQGSVLFEIDLGGGNEATNKATKRFFARMSGPKESL